MDRFEVVLAQYPAGLVVDEHSHGTFHGGVITSGEMILRRGGAEERLGPGQWYELAPGQVHGSRFEVRTTSVEFYAKKAESE